MNIRKALLLTLMIAIAAVGLTLTGCEQKSDHPAGGDHPAAEKATCPKCGEVVGSEACCATKAVEEAAEAVEEVVDEAVKEGTEAVKKAAAEHPTEHPKGEHPK